MEMVIKHYYPPDLYPHGMGYDEVERYEWFVMDDSGTVIHQGIRYDYERAEQVARLAMF